MQRQRQLERCGWEFFRVRECDFYSNKENALAGLWQALEDRDIFANSLYTNSPPKDDLKEEDCDQSDDDTSEDDDSAYKNEDRASGDTYKECSPVGHRTENITTEEIQDAILTALAKCPNHSCTLHSLTTRVLKELSVTTRGKPREAFELRTMRRVSILEKVGRIETYKAKNRRLRLVSLGTD